MENISVNKSTELVAIEHKHFQPCSAYETDEDQDLLLTDIYVENGVACAGISPEICKLLWNNEDNTEMIINGIPWKIVGIISLVILYGEYGMKMSNMIGLDKKYSFYKLPIHWLECNYIKIIY